MQLLEVLAQITLLACLVDQVEERAFPIRLFNALIQLQEGLSILCKAQSLLYPGLESQISILLPEDRYGSPELHMRVVLYPAPVLQHKNGFSFSRIGRKPTLGYAPAQEPDALPAFIPPGDEHQGGSTAVTELDQVDAKVAGDEGHYPLLGIYFGQLMRPDLVEHELASGGGRLRL